MTKEMPIGNGNENYNALKAFSICVRTYAYTKLLKNKNYFDIYSDTRDQVYGGIDGETEKTNSIVDETKGQLLFLVMSLQLFLPFNMWWIHGGCAKCIFKN